MKKALFVMVVSACMCAGLTSCKNDFTCTCTYLRGNADTTITLLYEDAWKNDAEAACEASEGSFKVFDQDANCYLR